MSAPTAQEVLAPIKGFPTAIKKAQAHAKKAKANFEESKMLLREGDKIYADWAKSNAQHLTDQARDGVAPSDFQPYPEPAPQVEQLLDIKKAYEVEARESQRAVGDSYGMSTVPGFLASVWESDGPGRTLDPEDMTAADYVAAQAQMEQVHTACTQMMVSYVLASGKIPAEVKTLRRLQSEVGTSKLVNHGDVELKMYSKVREASDAKALAEYKASKRQSDIDEAGLAAASRRMKTPQDKDKGSAE